MVVANNADCYSKCAIKNIWYGAHLRVITRQRPVHKKICAMIRIKCIFLFLNAPTSQSISGQTHGVNIKKSQ